MSSTFTFDAEALKDKLHLHFLYSGKVEIDHETGCWIYIGGWDNQGAGIMRVRLPEGSRVRKTHRLAAWAYFGGFDLDDQSILILQSCGNPACLNFDHLEVRRRKGGELVNFDIPLFPEGEHFEEI